MSTTPKPRGDAKLKTLPDDRQAEIIGHMKEHKLAETRAWLQADGLSVSVSSLSDFWDWWHLQEEFRKDAQTTDQLLEQMKHEVPNISDEQLDELGQRAFSLLAIRRKDADTFIKVRGTRTRFEIERAKLKLRERAEDRQRGKLKFEIEKFQFDAAKAALKHLPSLRQIARDNSLDERAKIEAARVKLFGELAEETSSKS